jgi:hypothetical protein
MIDFRLAVARIGYVFLTVWSVGWISFFAWGMIFQHVDWSEWPTLAATVFGYPFSMFLLWRLYLWMNGDFVGSDDETCRSRQPRDAHQRSSAAL